MERLGFERPVAKASNEDEGDKEHLRDAVVALERLESDIGSLSLEGTSTPPVMQQPPAARPRPQDDVARRIGVQSVAACLLVLLENLAEPVIPDALYLRAIRCEKREEACALVQDLPAAVSLLSSPAFPRHISLARSFSTTLIVSPFGSTQTSCCTSWHFCECFSTKLRILEPERLGWINSVSSHRLRGHRFCLSSN